MKYFEVNNDNNHLQIDDTYMNLYMTRKIKLDNTSGTIQFQNGEIIAAIGNGTNSINGYCSNSTDHCDYYIDNAQNAYIYIFASTPQSSSTSGMQIFNESGDLVFDSNQKQAKVVAVGTNNGTVIGSNIAIASGGLTKISDLTTNTRPYVKNETRYEKVMENDWVTEEYTDYGFIYVDGKQTWGPIKKTRTAWKPVEKWKWVTYYYGVIDGQDIYHTYTHNIYINGGVISTKQFHEQTSEGKWREIYRNFWGTQNYGTAWSDALVGQYHAHRNNSSGVISAYSYVVLDVNGL